MLDKPPPRDILCLQEEAVITISDTDDPVDICHDNVFKAVFITANGPHRLRRQAGKRPSLSVLSVMVSG
jgi:hypothetical protein